MVHDLKVYSVLTYLTKHDYPLIVAPLEQVGAAYVHVEEIIWNQICSHCIQSKHDTRLEFCHVKMR